SLLGRVQQALGLDATATLKDGVGNGLRFEALVNRRAGVVLDLGQLDEGRQLGTSPSIDRHLDLPGIDIGKPEQGKHRLTVEVRPVACAQERFGELVV
ncbi:MAG: hypothetical protein KDB28_14910, partial [Tetrasphaera sp.]|nr:hypothetical protein [Tetrasphaera sp.]